MAHIIEKTSNAKQETIADKKIKGLRKFRAMGRLVMANAYWLNDVGDSNITDNVTRNINIITRRKIKKSSLTLQEKAILCKPKEERTKEEKLILDKAIGGLKCFRRYPPHVKSQLAAVTYFVYFGKGRQIVKQDHVPLAMYFVLSGEAVVTVRHYDKFLDEWIEEESGLLTPGTMFGEVALIHGICRLATITTITPCELLMIKKEDFDIVLKETVSKAWLGIQKQMDQLSYFKNWDSVTKRECSIMARTKQFDPNETILGDDFGLPTYVYFIVKGTCCIIENLEVIVNNINGIEKYRLLEPPVTQDDTFESEIEKYRFLERQSMVGENEFEVFHILERNETQSKIGEIKKDNSMNKRTSLKSKLFSEATMPTGPSKVTRTETHFMKVCEFREGACFNIGEQFNRRRVVAVTPTHCLLVPRYWIVRNNADNIWSRVQQFLNKNIPNSQQIFEKFMQEKKFRRYSKKLVNDLLAEKKVANNNTIHNVPYSIRINAQY